MKKIALSIALAALFPIAAGAIEDKTVVVSGQDAEMQEAIQKAQDSLGGFLALSVAPPKGSSNFRLKVKFSNGTMSEHMWVMPFKLVNEKFVGILANEPEYLKNLMNGQRVSFERADISDWGYVQDGKQKGSFTVCVVFKHLPASEVKQYREQYGFEC